VQHFVGIVFVQQYTGRGKKVVPCRSLQIFKQLLRILWY